MGDQKDCPCNNCERDRREAAIANFAECSLYTREELAAMNPPYDKAQLNQCCKKDCCDGASASVIMGDPDPIKKVMDESFQQALNTIAGPRINWDEPVEYVVTSTGLGGHAQVRVLARGVRSTVHPGKTVLVAVTGTKSDILIYVDPVTGLGESARHHAKYTFRNIETKPTKAAQCFVNVYHNGNEIDGTVWEEFDTAAQANDENVFVSRDCLVRLVVEQKPGGNWTANAEVV